MLSKDAIKEFKEIYERVFGERLTDVEASLKAESFLNLYKAVYFDDEPCLKLENGYNYSRCSKVDEETRNKDLCKNAQK